MIYIYIWYDIYIWYIYIWYIYIINSPFFLANSPHALPLISSSPARHDLLKLFKTAAGSPQDALQRMAVSGAPSEAEWTSALQEGNARADGGNFEGKNEVENVEKWIGLVGKILTGNQSYFPIKIMGLSCKISLKPIHWMWKNHENLWYKGDEIWFWREKRAKLQRICWIFSWKTSTQLVTWRTILGRLGCFRWVGVESGLRFWDGANISSWLKRVTGWHRSLCEACWAEIMP